jgi:hypothetical protein
VALGCRNSGKNGGRNNDAPDFGIVLVGSEEYSGTIVEAHDDWAKKEHSVGF